jgi:hypothetical protein
MTLLKFTFPTAHSTFFEHIQLELHFDNRLES